MCYRTGGCLQSITLVSLTSLRTSGIDILVGRRRSKAGTELPHGRAMSRMWLWRGITVAAPCLAPSLSLTSLLPLPPLDSTKHHWTPLPRHQRSPPTAPVRHGRVRARTFAAAPLAPRPIDRAARTHGTPATPRTRLSRPSLAPAALHRVHRAPVRGDKRTVPHHFVSPRSIRPHSTSLTLPTRSCTAWRASTLLPRFAATAEHDPAPPEAEVDHGRAVLLSLSLFSALHTHLHRHRTQSPPFPLWSVPRSNAGARRSQDLAVDALLLAADARNLPVKHHSTQLHPGPPAADPSLRRRPSPPAGSPPASPALFPLSLFSVPSGDRRRLCAVDLAINGSG